MLRWGIVATLVWHYTVDASLVGLLLIRSSSLYFRVSGIVIGLAVLIPFGVAVYSRARRGTFEEDADLLNGAAEQEKSVEESKSEPAPAIAPTEAAAPVAIGERGYRSLSAGWIGFFACASCWADLPHGS
jgi:hypothetical protein